MSKHFIKDFNIFILEKYESLAEINVGKTYYSDVTFKDGFLETLQKTLDETKQNDKLILLGKEMNLNSFIDFLKATQSKQISSDSRCHVFDCISDDGYFEIIVIRDDNSKEETFKVHLNITDITKPMLYVEFAQLQYVAQ